MSVGREPFRKPLEDISNEEWIPILSIPFLVIAFLISGANYYFIDQAMTLFFYAVLVRIWTQVGGELPLFPHRNTAHISFILMSIGAVSLGIMMEQAAFWITGDLVAVQSLALAVVISRLYINIRDSNATSPRDIIRHQEPVDRYLILVPCAIAFFVSMLFYWLDVFTHSLRTSGWFFGMIVWSLFIGVFLYWYENER
ncbi:hypothetical protein ACLI4Z_19150 [Natrialbaceae archaeon A-arb3/5]